MAINGYDMQPQVHLLFLRAFSSEYSQDYENNISTCYMKNIFEHRELRIFWVKNIAYFLREHVCMLLYRTGSNYQSRLSCK